jgi:hypothetical protein
MAFSATDRVRIADRSSQWRGLSGEVKVVVSDDHDVRLDGHPCGSTQRFTTDQLKADGRTAPIDYTRCSA